MRYDEQRGIYRDCKWCGGKGCLACPGEADKAYKEAFPDGPKPIASFKLNDPKELEIAKKTIGRGAIDKAFAKDGGGLEEIIKNLLAAGKLNT